MYTVLFGQLLKWQEHEDKIPSSGAADEQTEKITTDITHMSKNRTAGIFDVWRNQHLWLNYRQKNRTVGIFDVWRNQRLWHIRRGTKPLASLTCRETKTLPLYLTCRETLVKILTCGKTEPLASWTCWSRHYFHVGRSFADNYIQDIPHPFLLPPTQTYLWWWGL